MWPTYQDWTLALYIILPTYCTNGAPVIFGGGAPLDFGRSLRDGQRIFGGHKTVRGLVSGLICGLIVGLLEAYFLGTGLLALSILASVGAVLGDLAGAFLKRRLKVKPGAPLPPLDQLDFVLGSLLLVSTFTSITWTASIIVILLTPPVHLLTNIGAYLLGLKANYW